MTVADIKKYIQNSKIKIDNMIPPNAKKKADEVLREVLSMLDELEEKPKANTSQWTQHYEMCGYVCDNCGHISENKDDVCSNCGARMNDELGENE